MAIYSKPRSEKKVAERLTRNNIEVYCPLQTTLRQWSDRKKKVQVPIFPSYVFVHVQESERITVLSDPSVLNFVYHLGKPAIIRDKEMEILMQFLDDDNSYEEISIHQYEKGDKVDIIAGPFKEHRAEVDEVNKSQVTLLLESLGMVVKIKTKINYINK